ncbi:hypothetical protein KC19_9G125700 [Ceratodon purpureus]|uniref:Protein kinase domain-containing protein n=1 Tax=Ceratodon purpureus TaxID=3225 RepID=A0A8T0GRB9_CERPU|nr:hypothetical protein KC19_9G125700 [Ceratodon purpureus]
MDAVRHPCARLAWEASLTTSLELTTSLTTSLRLVDHCSSSMTELVHASPGLRGNCRWRCLSLLFMALPVWATLEEGTILLNWKGQMSNGGNLTNWAGLSDPCGRNSSWFQVSCDSAGYVQWIDLGNSGLSGPLVPELGQLSHLEFLSVYNNSFNGEIPQELGDLTALNVLDLSANQFSGLIPASLSKLTNLENLNLKSNKFLGSFPVSLMQLYNVSELNLDSNYISGALNVTRILILTDAAASLHGQSIGIVSLMNNSVTDVDYQPDDLLNTRTVFKLQGNPYCNASVQSYDDGRRCFCLQNCSITTPQQGTILYNWKKTLSNNDKLINWNDMADPCASNPWFHVLCNTDGYVQRIDLGSSNLSGPLVPELGLLSKLETLTLYNNSFNGFIPEALGNLSALTFLDLSDNDLSGSIPDSFDKLTNLTFLKLSNNNLSNFYLDSLMGLPKLTDLQIQSNNFSGILNYTHWRYTIQGAKYEWFGIYSTLVNNSITDVTYQSNDLLSSRVVGLEGNPYCAGSPDLYDNGRRFFCAPMTVSITSTHGKRLAIIIGTVSSALTLVLAISLVAMFKLRAKRIFRKLEVEYRQKFAEFEVNPEPFLYNDLRLATHDFNESTKLGQGSFGTVYKGTLSTGNQVAIKKLKPITAPHGIEVDDFLNEVVFITKMKHRNLVDLKGYCMRGKERMLVYEYIENMDVEQSLLLGKNKEAMTWPVRFNICLGVAQGLHYLHAYAQPRVIHRDIKASNILLNINYAPKIADFGLALLFPDEKTHISTATVAGTRGYLAPEYASYGELSEKADVYSFGVLCLEIVSGRKNIDQTRPADQVYLPSWAWKLEEEKKLKDLVDPSLHLHADEVKQALRVINVALRCLQQIPDRRPSMSFVQTMLQGDLEPNEIVFTPRAMVDSSILEDSSVIEESALLSGPPSESTPSAESTGR